MAAQTTTKRKGVVRRSYKRRPEQVLAAARKETELLLDEARRLFLAGEGGLARRRVRQARRVAMRVQLRLPEFWHRYCRACDAPLIQGENSTIRIRGGIRILRCGECGAVRRRVLDRRKREGPNGKKAEKRLQKKKGKAFPAGATSPSARR